MPFTAKERADSFDAAVSALEQQRFELLQRAADLEATINSLKHYGALARKEADAK